MPDEEVAEARSVHPEEVVEQVTAKPKKSGLTKYTIYTTSRRMYIVGSNTRETLFRILEIDLTSQEKLTIMEDNVYFSRTEIMDVLNGLEETSEGGLTKKVTAVGLLGFIRFTKYYYLLVVTKRRPVAILGGYYVYHIDGSELIPVVNNAKKPARNSEEQRFLQTFNSIDLNKTFYYSYNYDITNTLQVNVLRYKAQSLGLVDTDLAQTFEYNERFVWNSHLLEPVQASFDRTYDWFQPIIHGFVDQIKISIYDADVYVTLIARRSHHFAGARFFKRGVNDSGNVANEVETEQIVSDMLTTSFHDAAAGFYNNPRITSFVQHRGSIPLSWSQATAPNIRMTKPPIELNVIDPYYSAAALHFDDLFKRYGSPVQVLNLIKQKEKTPRETKLLTEFESCISYLNQFLPKDNQIEYTGWDMSRASKSRGQDVITWLEIYSEKTLAKTGFFHNGQTLEETQLQRGVCRTNCIDCLDRTNTAQFVVGKRALGHQLAALGFIEGKYLEYDSDAINTLTEMFHDHGDTIALQYGGSHLVNTLQTYRKINQWSSHSRDMIESVKRFYSNSFMDAQRQDAINLFLGNYVYKEGHPMLWDLNTDYYLHNNLVGVSLNYRPSYTHWYSDCNLVDQKQQLVDLQEVRKSEEFNEIVELTPIKIDPFPGYYDNYWYNKYPPRELTSFKELFEYNMNSTVRYSISQSNNAQASEATSTFKSKLPGLTSSASSVIDTQSINATIDGGYQSSRVGGLDTGMQRASPFKSRKPHRELRFLEYGLTGENAEDAETSKSGDDNSESSGEPVYESFAEIQFSSHQVDRLTDNNEHLKRVLERTNDEVNEEIRKSKAIPVIQQKQDKTPPDSHVFDYVNETYVDDWESHGSSAILSDGSSSDESSLDNKEKVLEKVRTQYFDRIPVVQESDQELYQKVSDRMRHPTIIGKDDAQVEDLYEEYAGLSWPKLNAGDMEAYSQFADCVNGWKAPYSTQTPQVVEVVEEDERQPDPEESPERHAEEAEEALAAEASQQEEEQRLRGKESYEPNNLSVVEHPEKYFSFDPHDVADASDAIPVGGLQNEDILNSPFEHAR